MHPVAKRYLSLSERQKRAVDIQLCEFALTKWKRYMEQNSHIRYIEHVSGTDQEIDPTIPIDALESVRDGADVKSVAQRYLEPITALKDGDVELPAEIECAYYAIYNLYRKAIGDEEIDQWLVVNQAITALGNDTDATEILEAAIECAA